MKKLFLNLIMIAFLFTAAGSVLAAEGLTRISEHVYAYQDVQKASPANSFGANAGILVGETGVVVVDTLGTAKEAQRLIADIRKVTDKPILYVVDTHFHFDHAFGNSEFAKLGAVIVSHEQCRAGLEKYGENMIGAVRKMGLGEEDLAGTTVVYPTLTFSDAMTIHLGNLTAELKFVAPGHAPGGILIYVPEEKVLFTGDNLFTNFHAYLAGADLDGWQKNLDYILALGAEQIIPGHGPLSNNGDVSAMKEYLVIFDQKAKELCTALDNPDEIVAALEKELPHRDQGGWMIRSNVQGRYLKAKE